MILDKIKNILPTGYILKSYKIEEQMTNSSQARKRTVVCVQFELNGEEYQTKFPVGDTKFKKHYNYELANEH